MAAWTANVTAPNACPTMDCSSTTRLAPPRPKLLPPRQVRWTMCSIQNKKTIPSTFTQSKSPFPSGRSRWNRKRNNTWSRNCTVLCPSRVRKFSSRKTSSSSQKIFFCFDSLFLISYGLHYISVEMLHDSEHCTECGMLHDTQCLV